MAFLTEDYRRTAVKNSLPLLSGLDAQLSEWMGQRNRDQALLDLLQKAEEISAKENAMRHLTDAGLQNILMDFKVVFRRRERGYEACLPEALAAIREAALRTVGLHPYQVQIAGALALYQGMVAEMATGEGKTLTAGLTAVLWGWMGLPCHLITVNDYLAARDAKKLRPLYHFCGVSVGVVTGAMAASERRQGYAQDVTYTTCKEIIADFLRDRLWLGSLQKTAQRQLRTLVNPRLGVDRGLVMRGIHNAIVDEADSILIDEAVTPLIISRAHENNTFVESCQKAGAISANLKIGIHYQRDEQNKDIEFLPQLEEQLAAYAQEMPVLFRGHGRCRELLHQALVAREFFHRDQQYVVQGDKVVIVDEFTGRLMQQRTWRAGLHQLIEAKENLPITSPSETLARLSFQRFYRFFHKLSGMTGTAKESARELRQIYAMPVLSIPLNKPCQRKIYPRLVFTDQASKWRALVAEIVEMHELGRPVLIGTRSVKTSEELSAQLTNLGLPHQVLNAVKHEQEAQIVLHAGRRGTITVATNMAGRGTDIELGHGVAELGGLHVIASECHESARIDRQLFGRSARQGDPGSARSYVSLDDDLICRYVPQALRRAAKTALFKQSGWAGWSAEQVVAWAQAKAQGIAFRHRCSVLKMDTWLEDSLSFAQADIES